MSTNAVVFLLMLSVMDESEELEAEKALRIPRIVPEIPRTVFAMAIRSDNQVGKKLDHIGFDGIYKYKSRQNDCKKIRKPRWADFKKLFMLF
jgi:hypothetical protein